MATAALSRPSSPFRCGVRGQALPAVPEGLHALLIRLHEAGCASGLWCEGCLGPEEVVAAGFL